MASSIDMSVDPLPSSNTGTGMAAPPFAPMAQADAVPTNAQAVEVPPTATAVPVNTVGEMPLQPPPPTATAVSVAGKPNQGLHSMMMVSVVTKRGCMRQRAARDLCCTLLTPCR